MSAMVTLWTDYEAAGGQRLGRVPVVAGVGNFMMIRLPMSDTIAHRRLMAQGVMVRAMTGFRYPNHIRVTLSHAEAMEDFCRALRSVAGGR